jgi:UDP-N-acetylglucosamine acyltransferase
VIGDGCAVFAHAHVGHDCVVEAGAVLINGAMLGGHVVVEPLANVGGNVCIHQFVRIGTLAMIGGGSAFSVDIPPYCIAAGVHGRLFGLNEIGLKRNGLSKDAIQSLRGAYRLLFRSGIPRAEALAKARAEFPGVPEVARFVDFIASSKRGVARHGSGE